MANGPAIRLIAEAPCRVRAGGISYVQTYRPRVGLAGGEHEQGSLPLRMNNNNMKRMRGRNHRGGGGGPVRHQSGNIPLNRNHVFDSQGPDLRVRGTAQQLFEKYLQLGRDATSNNDRVMAEAYFQHAEHYFRIVTAINQAQGQGQNQGQQNQGGGQGGGQGQYSQQNGGNGQGGYSHNGPRREDEDSFGDQGGFGEQPSAADIERDLHREIPIDAAPSEA